MDAVRLAHAALTGASYFSHQVRVPLQLSSLMTGSLLGARFLPV